MKGLTTNIKETEPNEEGRISDELKGIFESHQSLLEYLDSCEDLLSLQNLSDHVVCGIQTCLGLFICLQQFWLPGYALLSCELLYLLVMNSVGTIIEVKLEKLSADVYDDLE